MTRRYAFDSHVALPETAGHVPTQEELLRDEEMRRERRRRRREAIRRALGGE